MIPTVPVTVNFNDQNGHPMAGGKVSAILTRDELYQGFVVPNQLTVVSDAAGVAVLNLFPNQLGSQGSQYIFKLTQPGGKTLSVTGTVPNAACALESIIAMPASPAVPIGQQAVDAAIAAMATANTAAGVSTTQAGIATTQATAASGSATAAAASAGVSTTQADIATTQADIATTQAGIATVKAADAAASAASLLPGQPNGVATLGADGKVPASQSAPFTGTVDLSVMPFVALNGATEVVKVIAQTGAYGSSAMTLNGGNRTNQPVLNLTNIGVGAAGIEVSCADGGYLKINAGGYSSPWLTAYTNRVAKFLALANAYSPGYPQAFHFINNGMAAANVTMLVQAQAGQTGDVLRIVDGASALLASVSPTGDVAASATIKTGVYTVATLPAGVAGKRCCVSDALSPAFLSVVAGGGAVFTPVIHNGTNWIVG